MIKLSDIPSITINNKKRKMALWKCTKCSVTKEGRADMVQTSTMCRTCSHITHGKEGTKVYSAWLNMKSRCYNTKNSRYSSYGGRGITVCQEWHKSEVFITWALKNGFLAKENERNTEYTIDRINNNSNYSPDNCRVVSLQVQQWNKQVLMSTNSSSYRGVSKQLNRWITVVPFKGKILFRYSCKTAIEAAIRREKFILDNNLSHILNGFSIEEIQTVMEKL